jgi:hypothetical protein
MHHGSRQEAAVAFAPMRIGQILATAFLLYRRHWPTLLAIVAVAVPLAVSMPSSKAVAPQATGFQIIVHHRVVAITTSRTATVLGVCSLAVVLLAFAVVVGATARAAAAAVAGEDLGVGRSYRFGLARAWSLLAAILMVVLLTVAGLVALFFPGVFVAVMLVATVPALVVEGRRPSDALARSWSLVAGHWWHAFGTVLLTWLLVGLTTGVVDGVAGRLIGAGWLAQTLVQAVVMTVATPFAVLVAVLLYLDLRARREPVDGDVLGGDLRASGG